MEALGDGGSVDEVAGADAANQVAVDVLDEGLGARARPFCVIQSINQSESTHSQWRHSP